MLSLRKIFCGACTHFASDLEVNASIISSQYQSLPVEKIYINDTQELQF